MVVNLSEQYSLLSDWISEIRDVEVQSDRMRFRRNLERIGEVAAFEISKTLAYVEKEVQTPLGTANVKVLKEQPVITTILRAGLPLHQGLLSFFDKADNGFISAYRKHNRDGSFEIRNLMRANDVLPVYQLRSVIDRELYHELPGRIAPGDTIEFV